ncbi:hypothetical protein AAHA92_12679 [Salvia divinorum]|uniref:Uncharacterized protein n=1 Tax=Salvia divinorum TaxID=28513 RepID=A0ABD1HQ54_SALDI
MWAEDFYYNEGSEQVENQVCWNLLAFSQFSGGLMESVCHWNQLFVELLLIVLVRPTVVENYYICLCWQVHIWWMAVMTKGMVQIHKFWHYTFDLSSAICICVCGLVIPKGLFFQTRTIPST